MELFDELLNVLQSINDEKFQQEDGCCPIPLFSFEGLPGAGKTTQIELVAKEVEKMYGKTYYIDLPTRSPVGKILKVLYSNEKKWNEFRQDMPWLNPIALSLDLKIAINEALQNKAKCALMSRGILSTIYYNIDAYGNLPLEEALNRMKKHLKSFYRPNAIFFLELPEWQAYERVLKRNRGPLRKMDFVEQMKKDRAKFETYLSYLKDIPVHYIDASGEKQNVTEKILDVMTKYFRR